MFSGDTPKISQNDQPILIAQAKARKVSGTTEDAKIKATWKAWKKKFLIQLPKGFLIAPFLGGKRLWHDDRSNPLRNGNCRDIKRSANL